MANERNETTRKIDVPLVGREWLSNRLRCKLLIPFGQTGASIMPRTGTVFIHFSASDWFVNRNYWRMMANGRNETTRKIDVRLWENGSYNRLRYKLLIPFGQTGASIVPRTGTVFIHFSVIYCRFL
ncbi:hypothetical protein CEXT_759291 [Caerostris extrusa]|uniref:Uncharacterized protein n=1 Tax=Caerostris extrusa TaxID=172846 RepID=A0AAV4UK59_CAEEX|nr:hypothetical protein CEXT_759291 [Caerostris extrusa]